MAEVARREFVTQAALARLRAALPDVTVQRNRRSLVDVSEAPHLNLVDAGHTAEGIDYGEMTYKLELQLEGAVRAETDEELGPALSAFYLRVVQAFGDDPTLAGACTQVAERALDVRVAPVEESEEPFAFLSLTFEVEFHSADGNPSASF